MTPNKAQPNFFTGKSDKVVFEDGIHFTIRPDDNTRMPNEDGLVVWKAKELPGDTLVTEYHPKRYIR